MGGLAAPKDARFTDAEYSGIPPVARAFSSSYLAGDPAALSFLPHDFREASARITRAREAARRSLPRALGEVLTAQQACLPPSPARQANLDALVAGNTAVVVSGQQVGLFLGPLYTFYKAASAIAVARTIEAESGVRCVPLFWLQTEDHDFAEIAGCTVPSADGNLVSLALHEDPNGDGRQSIAHRRLGSEVTGLLDTLATHLGSDLAADEVISVLRAQYVAGRSLADAFAGTLASVFSEEGLLIFDPRDARVAQLAAPIYRRAIEDADAIDRQLSEQSGRLRDAGFAEQVPLRPGCPLVFFHSGEAAGPRFRLQRHDADGAPNAWKLAGTDECVSQVDLLATIARDPLRASTSALLRPIVQDSLFPTVAYVGGPAEVSYFAQLMPLYSLFGLTPPVIVPRARFRCVDARARRLLASLALEPEDVDRAEGDLLERVAVARPADAPDPAALKRAVANDIAPLVARIADAITADRPHLGRAADRTRRSVSHALARLVDRYARDLLDEDSTARRRLQSLQHLLRPGGVAQERVYGWPTFAARMGPATFKRLVFERLAQGGPFVTELRELRP